MVEFKGTQVNSFLKSPDKNIRVFLVYGQDEGMVRERAKGICLTVLDSLDDPFCYTEMTASDLSEDPARLMDEIGSLSMMGGDRVIRIRNVTGTSLNHIKPALTADFSHTLLVIEAGDMKKDAALVKNVRDHKQGAVIPCFRDKAQDIASLVTEMMSAANLSIDRDANDYLRQNLGNDRSISRQEIDKLILFKGDEGNNITLSDVQAVIGDSSAESVFDVIDAALVGDMNKLEKTLNKAFFAGESPITFLRLIQIQLKQLHKSSALMEKGFSGKDALGKSGIPFFNHQKAQVQMGNKGSRHFATCLDIILQAELDCKTTGNPAEAICRRAFLRVGMAARRR